MATIQLGEIGNGVRRDSSGAAQPRNNNQPTQAVKPSPVPVQTSTANIATKDATDAKNNLMAGLAIGRTNNGATIRSDGRGGIYIDNSQQLQSNLNNPTPVVYSSGNTVVINGQGYSVAPEKQAEFIRNKLGNSSSGGRGGGVSQPQPNQNLNNLNPPVTPQPKSSLNNPTSSASDINRGTATFIKGTKPDENGMYYPSGFITSDGKFIESKDETAIPKGYDYATYKSQPEHFLYNDRGEVIGVESKYFGKSMTIDEYNKEIARVQKVMPQEKYYSPQTNKLSDSDVAVYSNGVKIIDLTPIKVFVDPNTGKPINNIGQYLVDNKIPLNTDIPDKASLYDVLNQARQTKTYDIQSIPGRYYATWQRETAGDVSSLAEITRFDQPISAAAQKLGATDKNIAIASNTLATIMPWTLFDSKSREFTAGAFEGIAKDIRDKPIENIALYGAGETFGFILKGGELGLAKLYEKIPKPIAEEIGNAIEESLPGYLTKSYKAIGGAEAVGKGVMVGVGTGIVGLQIKELIIQELNPLYTIREKGAIAGNVAKDNYIFIKGTGAGAAPFDNNIYSNYVGPEITTGIDVIQPIASEGRMISEGKFKIEANVPKRIIYSDMPIKKFFRDLGLFDNYTGLTVEKIIPAYRVKSIGTVVLENGKIIYGQAVTQRVGYKAITVDLLEGEQAELNIKNINNLPKLQKFVMQKSIGDFVPTDDSINYFQGLLRSTKALKFGGMDFSSENIKILDNARIDMFTYGKRTNIYSTVSMVKELEPLSVEGEYTAYETKIGLKNIDNPNARAKGNIIEISGFSKVFEPKVISEDVSDFYIKRFDKEAFDVSKSKTDNSLLTKFDSQKSVSTLQSVKADILNSINIKDKANFNSQVNKLNTQLSEANRLDLIPKYVGGTGKYQSSDYMGGKYIEDYNYGVLSLSIPKQNNNIQIKSLTFETELNKSNNREINKEVNKSYNKEINKEINKELNKEINKEINKELNKEVQKEIQKEIQKQVQKQVQKQINKPSMPLFTVIEPRYRTTKEPLRLPSFSNKEFNTKGTRGYTTFVKIKGKELFLPGVRSKGQAERYGEEYTLKNLRATFGVKPTSVKINQADTNFKVRNDLFRNYRISHGKKISLQDTWIQRRGKRLSNPFEVSEIQRARKKR